MESYDKQQLKRYRGTLVTYGGDDGHENQRSHGVRHEGCHSSREYQDEDECQPWIR